MKALITAGGRATRLRPITYTINKHLIPLANKAMIIHAIEKIRDAGITDIAININPGETEMQRVIGNGEAFGVKLTFLEQQGGPKGLAHIVRNAESWIGQESFLFYLGDNIILNSINDFVERFKQEQLDCLLALSKVPDPNRFGVPEFKDGRIVRIHEKPEQPPSDFAVTGIYMYQPSIFDAVKAIEPSARGEYEISDAHTWMIEHGHRIGWEEITGWWKDTGKPEDLLHGNHLLLDQLRSKAIEPGVIIEDEVIVDGPVEIKKGTRIGSWSVIRGPVSIGENCMIKNAVIGPHVSVADGTVIENTQIERSLLMQNVSIIKAGRITNSLFGKMVSISPGSSHDAGTSYLLGDQARIEF